MASWLNRALDVFRVPASPSKLPTPVNELDTVSSFVVGRPLPPQDFDPAKLVDEGYRRNVIVYVCVNEIASSAASPRVKLRVTKTQEVVEEHALLDLILRPSPGLGWYELVERLLIHQQTIGTAYIHKGRTTSGEVIELRPARPDRIQPVPDKQGNVLYYEYKVEGTSPQRIEVDDLAPFRLPDPLNDYHGLSPLQVAAIYGDIDNAAALYLRDFFANGAMPMGLLKFKQPNVRREDRLRVQQEWAEQYGQGDITPQRGGRWHNVGVLGGDVEYQPLASEPAQLRLDSVWGLTESRLCATFGVPPSIVQAKVGLQYNTYSNAESARRSFWTETLVPIYRRLADGLTRFVVAEFDTDLELFFDIDNIPELQEDLNARAERATKLFLSGVASFNEARGLSDLEKLDDASDFYAFPSNVKMTPAEEVKDGSAFAAPEPPPDGAPVPGAVPPQLAASAASAAAATAATAAGDEPPPEGQGDGGRSPFVLLGLRQTPQESEDVIAAATKRLAASFIESARKGAEASDHDALERALAAGNRRAAEKAVGTSAFVESYAAAFRAHMREHLDDAHTRHLHHHGADRETHARAAAKWRDRMESRLAQEIKRIDKEARDVVRSQILKVLSGDADAVNPKAIVGHLGLSDRQQATVERQRQRMLASARDEGGRMTKGRLNAIEKDLDHLRVKLLSERANTIAEFETRMAESLGQQAAWDRMLAAGELKGGRRHWHKLWVAAEDEATCGVCVELDGTETTLDGTFGEDEFFAPPEPHPNCRCKVTLVETTPGWRSPEEGDAVAVSKETHADDGHWVTVDDQPILIGGDPADDAKWLAAQASKLKRMAPSLRIGLEAGAPAGAAKSLQRIRATLASSDLPEGALNGLKSIGVSGEINSNPNILGWYEGWGKDSGTMLILDDDKEVKRAVLHEVGHHVHLCGMSYEDADEWAAISRNGKEARFSAYARTNGGEHFAEAFMAYAAGGRSRARLEKLEPIQHRFMKGVFGKPAFSGPRLSNAGKKMRYLGRRSY